MDPRFKVTFNDPYDGLEEAVGTWRELAAKYPGSAFFYYFGFLITMPRFDKLSMNAGEYYVTFERIKE